MLYDGDPTALLAVLKQFIRYDPKSLFELSSDILDDLGFTLADALSEVHYVQKLRGDPDAAKRH